MLPKTVLVTGGAGYIGSHTVLELLLGSFKIVVVDNLDNSSEVAIHRVKELVGKFGNILSFHKVDLRDKAGLEPIFFSTKFDVAIHFVGLKAVGESLQKPLLYYDNNLIGTITILEVVAAHGCKKSSSTIMPKSWGKGEYLCIRRELREIPISHYRSNQEEALLYAASVKRRSRNLSYIKRCSGSRDRHEQHISTAFV